MRHRGVTHSWGISGRAFGQSPLSYLKPRKRSGTHALPPQKWSSRSILWGGGVTTGPLEWKLASVDLPEVQPDLGPSQGPPASGCLQEVDPLWTSSSSWSPHGRLGTPLGCARTPSASAHHIAAPSPSHVCILSLSEPPTHTPTHLLGQYMSLQVWSGVRNAQTRLHSRPPRKVTVTSRKARPDQLK